MEFLVYMIAMLAVFTFFATAVFVPILLGVSTMIVHSIIRIKLISNQSSECKCGAYTNFVTDLKNGYLHTPQSDHFSSIISSSNPHSSITHSPGHSSVHTPSYASSIHNPITSTTCSANPHNIHRR